MTMNVKKSFLSSFISPSPKSALLGLVTGLLAASVACDAPQTADKQESRANSLDQFATGTGSYECSGNHLEGTPFAKHRYTGGSGYGGIKVQIDSSPEKKAALSESLSKALGAVPKAIGTTIAYLQGAVLVTPKASEICTKFQAAGPGSSAAAPKTCWIAKDAEIVLVFSADPEVLSQSVVRTFTYAFAEYFVHKAAKLSPSEPLAQFASQWIAGQAALAHAFNEDLATMGREVSSEVAMRRGDTKTFGHYVTAEAMDSFFCSASSQSVMKNQFPKTYEKFTKEWL